jgi:hypothetical protein
MNKQDLKENSIILKKIAKYIYSNLQPGIDAYNVIVEAENMVTKHNKKIIEPFSLEIDNIVGNCSPVPGMFIKKRSCISYSISIMNNNESNKLKLAITKSMDKMYIKEIKCIKDIITNDVINNFNFGEKITDISKLISKKLKENNIGTLTNICGYKLDDNRIIIPNSLNMTNELKDSVLKHNVIDTTGVYFIDIYGTNTSKDKESQTVDKCTIYFIPPTNKKPKIDIQRALFVKLKHLFKNKRIFGYKDIYSTISRQYQQKIFGLLCKTGFIISKPVIAVPHADKIYTNVFHIGVSIFVDKDKTYFI